MEKIIVSAKNIDLTEPIEVFINQKIGGLLRYLKGFREPVEVRVEIGRPSRHHRSGRVYYAEVNLLVEGKTLRAQSYGDDVRSAIIDVKEALRIQIKKLKDKKRT